MNNPCCVVDQFCTAPANYENANARAVCFSCGLPVCGNCSSIRTYYAGYGKRRLCNNCQIDLDGNDKIVKRRLMRLASK